MILLSLTSIAVILLALAAFIVRASPYHSANRWFAAYTVVVALWVTGVAMWYAGHYAEASLRIAFASASFIPATFLGFARCYPVVTPWPPFSVVATALFGAAGFALMSLLTSLVASDASTSAIGEAQRRTGPLYPLFALYFLATFFAAAATFLATFLGKWQRVNGRARAQLRYLAIAILVSAAGAITTNLVIPLATGSSKYSWMGPYFAVLFLPIVAHALIRYRIPDLKLVVHGSLTLAVATALAVLPMMAVIAIYWPQLSGQLGPEEMVVLTIGIIVMSLLVSPTRDITVKLINTYVYRVQADYRQTVLEASHFLTRMTDVRLVLSFLPEALVERVGSEGAAVYLGTPLPLLRIGERHSEDASFRTPDAVPHEVTEELLGAKSVLSAAVQHTAANGFQEEMARLNWSLVLPLLSDHSVIGAIVVGPKLSGDPFYKEDVDLLVTLANQAVVAVKNSQLYGQVFLANEYIENILATMESGVVAIDSAGSVSMFNRAAERFTGISQDVAKRSHVETIPECLKALLQETLADGVARSIPEVALSDGKVTRPVICTTSPLRDPNGAVLGAVAVFSDLTALKELEVERHRAEKLAYFEMLASALAHEIKNPLVAVKAFAQLVPRRLEDGRFVDRFSHIVTREIGRMERLIDRLRALSRPGDRPRAPLDVRVPLTKAVEFLHPAFEEKRIRVTLGLAEQPLMIEADETAIEELVLNLLMNAYEVLKPESEVTVRVSGTSELATVVVEDTGPGIPPELMERVFDPFFTTKQRGSGLRLAISASIARSHGARLRATNRPGGGAAFSVEFPLLATVPLPARA